MKHLLCGIAFLLLMVYPVSFALAHKVRVFAYANGAEIITESKFNNGRPAINSSVVVMNNADGAVLVKGKTDKSGLFTFPLPPQAKDKKMDLNIVVDLGEGHKGSWLLSADDYLPGELYTDNHRHIATTVPSQKTTPANGLSCTELEQIIERVVEKNIAPIKRSLALQQEQKLTIRDILGGLGYIFGLAGVAVYFQTKKQGKKR